MIDRRQFIAALTAGSMMRKAQLWPAASEEKKATSCGLNLYAAQRGDGFDLESSALRVRLSSAGGLERMDNLESQEAYLFSCDCFSITTNKGTFSNLGLTPDIRVSGDGVISYKFVNKGQYNVLLNYRLGLRGHYIERWLAIEDVAISLELIQIKLSWICAESPPQVIKYDTFWNTPTVVFLRWHSGGLFTGIENPFFMLSIEGTRMSLSYEPSLFIGSGEAYQGEPQFIGVFSRTGKTIKDHYLPTLVRERPHMVRFRNPSGHIPLDWNEIQSMRRFVYDYLSPRLDRFMFSLYMYWYPIEQLWSLPDEKQESSASIEAKYKRIVKNFSEIGGDLIIFNPLSKYMRPGASTDSYWNVAPPESAASRILAFTQENGIEYGFYMGVAAQGDQGNACALPFAPERPDWKKVDLAGGTSGENCIACRGFVDWWYEVQRNTISRFDLRFWSWDPGPGNGSFCYSRDHGHVPGKGAYKGWREATRLTGRLKSEFPKLLLMAFYGRKEYGLWGLKNFDLHESYWEQTILYGATKHPDLHDDRTNANGARFQSWWNENFRFLPTTMNHALVHRIGENSYDSRLPKVWDHLGWRYSLMSAIATSGNCLACILPEELSNVREFKTFYQKWVGWARKNFEYVRYNVSLGDQVRPGGVDVHARIKGDHGFIFLCNPGPRPARTEFELNSSIGLQLEGSFTLKELHPAEHRFYFDGVHDRGVYQTGDTVSVTVPPYEVCLFELSRFDADDLPLIFGVEGEVQRHNDIVTIVGMTGQPGEVVEVVALSGRKRSKPTLTINQRPVKLSGRGQYRRASLQFVGKPLPRALDDWWTPNGKKFIFPFHDAANDLSLRTRIVLDSSIRELLDRAVPPNLHEFQELLESWRENLPHTYAWARPDRLWLAIPFTDPDYVRDVALHCNGKEIELHWFAPRDRPKGSRVIAYSDITDVVSYGSENQIDLQLGGLQANQFLGPFLDYPLGTHVTGWVATRGPQPAQVVYERPVDPEMPARVASIGNTAPRVVAVQIDPPSIRPMGKHTFMADLNMPAEHVENVWVSVGSSGEAAMSWDNHRGKWTYEWTAPTRPTEILDAELAFVWAVSKDGILSESFPVAIRWIFT